MGLFNREVGYGGAAFKSQHISHRTTGRTFMVASSTESNFNTLSDLWKPDPDGTVRLYTDITSALAACTAGRGDVVLLSPGFTTAPTLTELATCGTKGVMMEQAGGKLGEAYVTLKAAANLPQSGNSDIFTVTAPVKILDIIAEVSTAIQNQANSVTLAAIPTVGSSTNLATAVSVTNAATGTILAITGTLANAMQKDANGVLAGQATPVIVPAGKLNIHCGASNTGQLKWVVRYQPLVPGARVFSAS